MRINHSLDTIRQQEPGQFKIPENGKEPFVHVSDQKLDSINEAKERSVYINNENIASLNGDSRSDFPTLFDYDAGLKFNTRKMSETHREEKLSQQYNKTGNPLITNEPEGIIDQLA